MASERTTMQDAAVESFIKDLEQKYGHHSDRIKYFEKRTLETAINMKKCERREGGILLYLHNKSRRTTLFNHLLLSDAIPMVKDFYLMLGWDIENETYHGALCTSLQKYPKLGPVCVNVVNKQATIVFIHFDTDGNDEIFVIDKDISEDDFRARLSDAIRLLNLRSEEEEDNQPFNSQRFLNYMCEQLGDRDYESYEHNELDILKKKIGYAFFGPPVVEEGYVDRKQQQQIDLIFNSILRETNLYSEYQDYVLLSIIYICTEPLESEQQRPAATQSVYDSEIDFGRVPVFIMPKCKRENGDSACMDPCRIIIDDRGRVYSSWQKFLKNNKLPECMLVVPKMGRYTANAETGDVELEKYYSPACKLGQKALKVTDVGSSVVGIGAGLVFAVGAIPAVTLAPVVAVGAAVTGAAVGLYSIVRSSVNLHDRNRHKESMSVANPECRGAYLNIAAGTLGFVGAGVNATVSQLAARGFTFGQVATNTVTGINIVNIGASGLGVGNSVYDVYTQWTEENQAPSVLTIVQLSSSVLFFGHACYSFKSGSTIIEESQMKSIKEYGDGLRSNRHRKTFSKLVKETIRTSPDDVSGRAAVIKAVRNIANKDEVFAALTRNNKAMNKAGIRFAARNGEITLNGMAVDVTQFASIQKNELSSFFATIQNQPEPTVQKVSETENELYYKFHNTSMSVTIQSVNFLLKFLAQFDLGKTIKENIENAIVFIAKELAQRIPLLNDYLAELFPSASPLLALIKIIVTFIIQESKHLEEKFRKWFRSVFRSEDPSDPDVSNFRRFSTNSDTRFKQIVTLITKLWFSNNNEERFKELFKFVWTFIAEKIYESNIQTERLQNRSTRSAQKRVTLKDCEKCFGVYFQEI